MPAGPLLVVGYLSIDTLSTRRRAAAGACRAAPPLCGLGARHAGRRVAPSPLPSAPIIRVVARGPRRLGSTSRASSAGRDPSRTARYQALRRWARRVSPHTGQRLVGIRAEMRRKPCRNCATMPDRIVAGPLPVDASSSTLVAGGEPRRGSPWSPIPARRSPDAARQAPQADPPRLGLRAKPRGNAAAVCRHVGTTRRPRRLAQLGPAFSRNLAQTAPS